MVQEIFTVTDIYYLTDFAGIHVILHYNNLSL